MTSDVPYEYCSFVYDEGDGNYEGLCRFSPDGSSECFDFEIDGLTLDIELTESSDTVCEAVIRGYDSVSDI